MMGARRDETRLEKVSSRLVFFKPSLENLEAMVQSHQSIKTCDHVTLGWESYIYNHANCVLQRILVLIGTPLTMIL
jgi:hypothetical protein